MPKKARIAEAILYLIARAEQTGAKPLSQYDIVKSLFVADTGHICKYGRPITYDNYVAMKHGPVPSESYDMLKADYKGLEEWPLWTRTPTGGAVCRYHEPVRQPDLTQLSVSERHELDAAQDIVLSQSFTQTKDMTHRHPAYVEAWVDDAAQKAFPMNYLLFVDEDEDVLDEIVLASKYA